MLIRESPVGQVKIVEPQLDQTTTSLASASATRTSTKCKTMSGSYHHPATTTTTANGQGGQMPRSLASPSPAPQQQQHRQQPLVSVVHQFVSDDFEPNPVYNPAAAAPTTTHPLASLPRTVAPSPGPPPPPPPPRPQFMNNNPLQPSTVPIGNSSVVGPAATARAGTAAQQQSSIHNSVGTQARATTTSAYGALHPSRQPVAPLPTQPGSTTAVPAPLAPQQAVAAPLGTAAAISSTARVAPPAPPPTAVIPATVPQPIRYAYPPAATAPGSRIAAAVPTRTGGGGVSTLSAPPQVASIATARQPQAHTSAPPTAGYPPAAAPAATGGRVVQSAIPTKPTNHSGLLPHSQQQHPPDRLAYRPPPPPIPGSISFPTGPLPPTGGAAAPTATAAAAGAGAGPALQPPTPPAVASAGGVPAASAAAPPSAPQPPPPQIPKPMDRRKQFLLFVKILLKHLEKNAEDRIRLAAKRMLTECIQKNRQGDPDYTPLHLAAEARILPIVGPKHWNRSVQYLNLHLKRQAEAQFAAQQAAAQQQQQHALAVPI